MLSQIEKLPRMEKHLFQNELLLFVTLNEVRGHTPDQAIALLKQMGYSPELQSDVWEYNGVDRADTCAVLHRQVHEDGLAAFDEMGEQWNRLADVFGSEAVNLVLGSDE